MPITNMQIAQGSISSVQSTTNYEGDEVDLGVGDGDGDDADVDGDDDASPTPRRSAGDDCLDFPLFGGVGAAGSSLSRRRRGLSPPPPPR